MPSDATFLFFCLSCVNYLFWQRTKKQTQMEVLSRAAVHLQHRRPPTPCITSSGRQIYLFSSTSPPEYWLRSSEGAIERARERLHPLLAPLLSSLKGCRIESDSRGGSEASAATSGAVSLLLSVNHLPPPPAVVDSPSRRRHLLSLR